MYLPEPVLCAINLLEIAGFEVFVVGGAVRDFLLSRPVSDYDLATSAKPDDILCLFSAYRLIPTGIVHGTITVIINEMSLEITTYRSDGDYLDARHPEQVDFVNSLSLDVARRDFTINAIAYNPSTGFIDYVNGINDIKAGVVRAVGVADIRFKEDALRMIRCFRFASQLGFSIDSATLASIKDNAPLLSKIAYERINIEFSKILLSNDLDKIYLMKENNLLAYIIPEFLPCFDCSQNIRFHIHDVAKHTIEVMKNTAPVLTLRLAALLHDIGKPHCKSLDDKGCEHFYGHVHKSEELAKTFLTRLRYNNSLIDNVLFLIKYHDADIVHMSVRHMLSKIGVELMYSLLELKVADAKGQNPVYLEDRLYIIEDKKQKVEEILKNKECFSIKDLAINGSDIMKATGLKGGPEIGLILNHLLDMVLDNPDLNKRDELLRAIIKFHPTS